MAKPRAPPWPGLYDPGLEILHIEHHNAIQPGASYLYHARDVFRYTLFWTLILYTPIFLLCGSYAFWNLNFPPSPRYEPSLREASSGTSYQLASFSTPHVKPLRPQKLPRENERRSRLAFALLVLFTFATLSVAGAVTGSAVLAFSIFGLYTAANFNMSTWIPFLLAVMQVLVGLLSIWPSIIDII
ncbi:hypothetical protein Hypma_003563 [Hypsizygus marmoreus]|uniref:Uncharacterized protein n=1 Tax=Hypsizygus marmoreus TaxID=39966 RepID=A0A369J5N5_HYPMA|nr:hypothetical protein Hypma_003563 [Hypsizygus marmoreus]